MSNNQFIKCAAIMAFGTLILTATPAVALTASVSGERALPGQSSRLQLVEWQGGKAKDSKSDWDKGGGYGGKPEKHENSKDDSDSGSDKNDKNDKNDKSDNSDNSSKKDNSTSKGDSCSDKFVPGSKAWNACKGISTSNSGQSNGSAKKPENAFLTPAQCAAKFKKGSREYLACIM